MGFARRGTGFEGAKKQDEESISIEVRLQDEEKTLCPAKYKPIVPVDQTEADFETPHTLPSDSRRL